MVVAVDLNRPEGTRHVDGYCNSYALGYAFTMRGIFLITCSLPLALNFWACSDDASEGSTEATSCEATEASIQAEIFVKRCAGSGCHGSTDPAGALDLASPGVGSRLIGVTSSCNSLLLVAPGQPNSSHLYQKLTSQSPACGDPMPPSGQLDSAALACVRAWIESLANTGTGGAGGAGTTTGCAPDSLSCSGSCVDPNTDARNCGACGVACGAGSDCVSGTCTCSSTPASVSFANDVQPIFDANCVNSGCHSGAVPRAGLLLTAGNAHAELVGAATSQCGGTLTRVTPGDPAASYLMNKLLGIGMCTGEQMPKAGQSLSGAEISLIHGWICANAPDN